MFVVFRTCILDPNRIGLTTVGLHHRPGTRQGVIDGRDLIVQDVRIRFVDKYPLLDDCLIVRVQSNAG